MVARGIARSNANWIIRKVTIGLDSVEIERNPRTYGELNTWIKLISLGYMEGLSNFDRRGIANARCRRDSL